MEPANDQGDNISWSNNLMYPTEGASIIEGATTTSFSTTESIEEDPFLSFDEDLGIWRTTSSSPKYNKVIGFDEIVQDIDGQTRPSLSNPGADHFSSESVRFRPLTTEDVGPNAPEGVTTSVIELITSHILLILIQQKTC
jgi:poly(beta-D-mannuronate) lyase